MIFCICCGFNIILNAILIPKWLHLGACVATVLTEFFLLLCCYVAVRKYIFKPRIFSYLVKPGMAAAVMYIVLILTKTWLLVFSIAAGAIAYIVMLFILPTFDNRDRELLIGLMTKRKDTNAL